MKYLLPSVLLLASAAGAQHAAQAAELTFPLAVTETWGDLAVRLAPVPTGAGGLADLSSRSAVRLTGATVPTTAGFELVDLDLERFHVVAPGAQYRVDGALVGGRAALEATHSLWRGRVVGEPDSSVFLAFTTTGSRGWIQRADGKSHLVSVPIDGDWSDTYSVLVHESAPMLRDAAPSFGCQALSHPGTSIEFPDVAAGKLGGIQRAVTTYELTVALETDYQYWQLFGDTTAATNYALSLFGAVSERYLAACDTFVTLPYLAIYSNSNDPWSTPEQGGSSIDMLYEFQGAWGGSSFPGNANLAHLMSGANLGGGVAWLDVLCDNTYGFAVSGNLHGMLNFPVPTQDSLNWDFVVVAHEIGHNVGTPHTHDYCPVPLDECASSAYFGACQTKQTCQVGTIMGYCHLCSGGMNNVKTEFHPTVASLMAGKVQSSCLGSYAPASLATRNGSGQNPVGYTSSTAPELGTTWSAQVSLAGATASYLAGTTAGPASGTVVSFGEVLLDLSQPFVLTDVAVGAHSIPIPNDLSLLGVVLYTQAASFGSGVQLQNALDLTLGR